MPIQKAGDGNLEPRSVSFDIGVGRFRILGGGGARFRILGRPRGGGANSQ